MNVCLDNLYISFFVCKITPFSWKFILFSSLNAHHNIYSFFPGLFFSCKPIRPVIIYANRHKSDFQPFKSYCYVSKASR